MVAKKRSMQVRKSKKVGRKYFCSDCETKGFPSRSEFKRHKLSHLKIKPHRCTFCDATFAQKTQLTTHINIHKKIKPYKCPDEHCDKIFTDRSSCSRHHWETHGPVKRYDCPDCAKTSYTRDSIMMKHLKAKHDMNNKVEAEAYCITLAILRDDVVNEMPEEERAIFLEKGWGSHWVGHQPPTISSPRRSRAQSDHHDMEAGTSDLRTTSDAVSNTREALSLTASLVGLPSPTILLTWEDSVWRGSNQTDSAPDLASDVSPEGDDGYAPRPFTPSTPSLTRTSTPLPPVQHAPQDSVFETITFPVPSTAREDARYLSVTPNPDVLSSAQENYEHPIYPSTASTSALHYIHNPASEGLFDSTSQRPSYGQVGDANLDALISSTYQHRMEADASYLFPGNVSDLSTSSLTWNTAPPNDFDPSIFESPKFGEASSSRVPFSPAYRMRHSVDGLPTRLHRGHVSSEPFSADVVSGAVLPLHQWSADPPTFGAPMIQYDHDLANFRPNDNRHIQRKMRHNNFGHPYHIL